MINTNWQTIDTAPKDGTPIFITHPDWAGAVKARWGKHPWWEVILDETGRSVIPHGWVYDWGVLTLGRDYDHQAGFLGAAEDIENGCMPTHWCWPPTTEEKNDG
jgi:hypothetical protein